MKAFLERSLDELTFRRGTVFKMIWKNVAIFCCTGSGATTKLVYLDRKNVRFSYGKFSV